MLIGHQRWQRTRGKQVRLCENSFADLSNPDRFVMLAQDLIKQLAHSSFCFEYRVTMVHGSR